MCDDFTHSCVYICYYICVECTVVSHSFPVFIFTVKDLCIESLPDLHVFPWRFLWRCVWIGKLVTCSLQAKSPFFKMLVISACLICLSVSHTHMQRERKGEVCLLLFRCLRSRQGRNLWELVVKLLLIAVSHIQVIQWPYEINCLAFF